MTKNIGNTHENPSIPQSSWLIISDYTDKELSDFWTYLYTVFVRFAASAGVMSHRLRRLVPLSFDALRIFGGWFKVENGVLMSFVRLNVGILRLVVEAFRWSLALIAKILVRSITEGSTLATWQKGRKATLISDGRGAKPSDFSCSQATTCSLWTFLIEWYWMISTRYGKTEHVHKKDCPFEWSQQQLCWFSSLCYK